MLPLLFGNIEDFLIFFFHFTTKLYVMINFLEIGKAQNVALVLLQSSFFYSFIFFFSFLISLKIYSLQNTYFIKKKIKRCETIFA